MRVVIPLAAFKVHSIGNTTTYRLDLNILRFDVVQEIESKGDLVYGNRIGSSIILKVAGEESLWEEESGHPVNYRSATCDPLV